MPVPALWSGSGGPPYAVYEITPTVAFGLPTDGEKFAPTRWRFGG